MFKIKTTHRQAPTCKALPRFARVLCLGLTVLTASTSAIDVPKGTSKLQLANEIDKAYVVPLGLKGKPADQAIAALLADGFRCQLQYASGIVPSEPPLSRCVKLPSGFGELCDELTVTLRFERLSGIASQVNLLERLDTIKVASALPFCPDKRQASVEYLAGRSEGEAGLAQQVSAFNLVGNAKAAYDKLLVEGFYCGFDLDAGAQKAESKPKLVCTKVPSQIKLCFESKLVMDVQWPTESRTTSQLLDALKLAEIKAIRSSCEVPAKKGKGDGV